MKKYLNKMKIARACDSIIFEIPILTVEIIVDYTTVKIGVSNIIKSQATIISMNTNKGLTGSVSLTRMTH